MGKYFVEVMPIAGVYLCIIAFDASYRTLTYLVGMTVNSSITDQPSEETSARQSVDLSYQRFRNNRWFTGWFTTWESNDELGINSVCLRAPGSVATWCKRTRISFH